MKREGALRLTQYLSVRIRDCGQFKCLRPGGMGAKNPFRFVVVCMRQLWRLSYWWRYTSCSIRNDRYPGSILEPVERLAVRDYWITARRYFTGFSCYVVAKTGSSPVGVVTTKDTKAYRPPSHMQVVY
jgi:hypothetical protein